MPPYQPLHSCNGARQCSLGKLLLERRQLSQLMDARIDFLPSHRHQPLCREFLDGEGAERGAVHNCAAHVGVAEVAGSREISNEPASECVAGARRIKDTLQWVGGREENTVCAEHEGAMLAFLDDDMLGSETHDPFRRLNE